MKKKLILLLGLAFVLALHVEAKKKREVTIVVSNVTAIDRMEETVEVRKDKVLELLKSKKDVPLAVYTEEGTELLSQCTHDGKLLFQVKLAANETMKVVIREGRPMPVDTLVCGALYPDRKDDLTWENDKGAFRAYGPALQRSGERSFGYDIWTKKVTYKVVPQRYVDNANGKSFHKDHGDGMDVYGVGPTLGGGTSALFIDQEILYPYCFSEYEILDNGPIRFSASLTYLPTDVKGQQVVEKRHISLDKGSWLNRTVVSYEGLQETTPVVTGIVLHQENPYGYRCFQENGYMLYADLTQDANAGHGVIYVGAVFPEAVASMSPQYFPREECRSRSAVGHLLAETPYAPGSEYVYYWGAAWSKGGCPTAIYWEDYLKNYSRQLQQPLSVELVKD